MEVKMQSYNRRWDPFREHTNVLDLVSKPEKYFRPIPTLYQILNFFKL